MVAGSMQTAERSRTLRSELEERRLEHRATRIRLVLAAMHRIADRHDDSVPMPLRSSIDDFGRELAAIEDRLGRIDGRSHHVRAA